jgi:hypothetical protein
MCVRACSLAYAACKAHAQYCIVICGLYGSTMFYLIHGTIFVGKKNVKYKMCVMIFSTTLI